VARVPLSIVSDVPIPATPPSDYESIQSSPADFGGLIGQAEERVGAEGQQAGNNLAQIAEVRQQRFNQVAGDDAMNQFMDRGEALTYGNPNDPTAPKGLYSLKGSDALSAGPEVVSQLTQLRDQIKGGLQNDVQKLQFDEQSRRYFQYKSSEISRHLDQQSDVYAGGVAEAGIQAAATQAAHSYTSDDTIMHSLADAQSRGDQLTGLKYGATPDQTLIDQGQIAARTKVIRSAVEGAMATDPSGGGARAAQILGKFGGLIDPGVREELTRITKGAAAEAGVAAGINNVTRNPGAPPPAPDPAVVGQIQKSAAAEGVPADQALTIAHIESGIGTVPDRSGSQYGGVFQLGTAEKASVNLAAGAPPVEQAAKGVQFLANAYGVASGAVGHPADGWQTYMVHQQGVGGGPALLKADPNELAVNVLAEAGSTNPVAAVTRNGGSGDMTVGQFLGVWQAKYAQNAAAIGVTPGAPVAPGHNPAAFGYEQQMMDQARAEGQRLFPTDPVHARQVEEGVWQHIQQTNMLQAKQEAEQAKALKDAQEGAANNLVTTLLNDPTKFDPTTITKNPSLTADQKENLTKFAQEQFTKVGREDLSGYGPGYTKAYSAIFAPPADPTRITDLNDILKRGGPGGDLTLRGVDVLRNIFLSSRKDPDAAAVNTTALSMLTYAKRHLSFEQDDGFFKVRDPKGEDIYNAQFVPEFERRLTAAKASGNPADIDKFLSQDSIDKMMGGMRSPTDMARDRLLATGQSAPGEIDPPNAPIPPAPKGLNAGEWSSIMTAPPIAPQTGKPYTHAAWGQVLQKLAADPQGAIPWFNHYFGAAGYDGAELVERLTRHGAPSPAELTSPSFAAPP